jgi:predicted amidohydrolase
MKNEKNVSRRNFLIKSSIGLGAGIAGATMSSFKPENSVDTIKLPGKICVATIDLKGLWPDSTRESRIRRVLDRMGELAGLNPDIICLPELFDTMWVQEKMAVKEVAEDEKIPGPVASRIAEFAMKNNCYVACPIYTKNDGHFYNSTLLIDRKGKIAGVYHKMHPTSTEILKNGVFGSGVSAGALNQPVIQTDFGKVGMQICYDANWVDGWDNLKKQGANMILFSSAFPGGRILNHYALENNCYIISSTGGDARIIDISGNDLDSSSTFVRYAWANINLEKVNVDTWPTNGRLPSIFKKYGNRLGIKVWDENGVITIESHDPNINVTDVLKEFKIPSSEELLQNTFAVQNKYRL